MANEPNGIFELKQGASGSIMIVRLRDNRGPVDLSDFSEVKIVVRRDRYTPPVINSPVLVNPNQNENRGYVKQEFDSVSAAIPTGDYDVEFHGWKDGKKHIFPTSWQPAYNKLRVVRSLTP